MPKTFNDNKFEVLSAFYRFIRFSDGQYWVTAADISPFCDKLLSKAFIDVILQSLVKERLVRSEAYENEPHYSLTDKGIIRAEEHLIETDRWNDLEAALADAAGVQELPSEGEALDRARTSLDELAAALEQKNDLGELTVQEAAVARDEVADLRNALDKPSVRPKSFAGKARDTLMWIAERAGGTVIAELAKKAFSAILGLLGLLS